MFDCWGMRRSSAKSVMPRYERICNSRDGQLCQRQRTGLGGGGAKINCMRLWQLVDH